MRLLPGDLGLTRKLRVFCPTSCFFGNDSDVITRLGVIVDTQTLDHGFRQPSEGPGDGRQNKMGIFAKPDLDIDWQESSNCLGVDPDLFFPERGASTREAKDVCRACVVRMDCLEFALQNGEKFGIWGGMSERERRRIRRQRALERAAAAAQAG